jgi:outer membrane immunogenic protein
MTHTFDNTESIMKKILLAGAALIASVTMASAADLPSRKGAPLAPMYAPAFTWTGFYAGVNAGYGWGDQNTNRIGNSAAFQGAVNAGTTPLSFGGKPDGFIGGGQIGYNYQMNSIVIGAEADIQFADIKETRNIALPGAGAFLPSNSSSRQEMKYFGTVRARLGFTPVDRLLVYATGGLAYADVSNRINVTYNPIAGGDFFGRTSDTRTGWTAGGGLEYAITNNITIKGEYLYYDLGNKNIILRDPVRFPVDSLTYRSESKGNIVRAGINYKF